MQLSRATGWYPWIAQDARDIDHTPYAHRQVEISREEWNGSQIVDPRSLDPMMNVVDLWWSPVEPAVAATQPDAALAYEAWVLRKERQDETAAALSAYAVWYRYTYPIAPHAALSAWQMLSTYPEGRAIQAMWHAIAQAVLDHDGDA